MHCLTHSSANPAGEYDTTGCRTTLQTWAKDHLWSKSHFHDLLWCKAYHHLKPPLFKRFNGSQVAKGSYVTGQHGRLDSEIQNLQGRTKILFQLTGKKCSIRNSNAISVSKSLLYGSKYWYSNFLLPFSSKTCSSVLSQLFLMALVHENWTDYKQWAVFKPICFSLPAPPPT